MALRRCSKDQGILVQFDTAGVTAQPMLSIFIAVCAAAVRIQSLDAIAAGDWTIHVSEFLASDPDHPTVSYYNAVVRPSEQSDVFKGDVYGRNDDDEPVYLNNIELAFEGPDKARVHITLGQESLATIDVKESLAGLRTASGNLSSEEVYSASVFSEGMITFTVMEPSSGTFTVYTMIRPAPAQYKCQPCMMMQFMPIILLLFTLFGNRGQQRAPAPQPPAEPAPENAGADGHEKAE